MKKTTINVTFSTEKIDALTFHMEKKEAKLQTELTETIQKLYEKYVPQATREYIDDKVARDSLAKDKSGKLAVSVPDESRAADS